MNPIDVLLQVMEDQEFSITTRQRRVYWANEMVVRLTREGIIPPKEDTA